MSKKLCSIILSVLMVFSAISVNTVVFADESDEWLILDPPEKKYYTGYIPSDDIYPIQPIRFSVFSTFPSQYPTGITYSDNTYTIYRINRFQSSVKDQGSTGLCWAFASLGAIEASTIKSIGNVIDLSPLHAAHALSTASGNNILTHQLNIRQDS